MSPQTPGAASGRLAFAQVAGALDPPVGLCAGRIHGLGLPEVRQAAGSCHAGPSPC